MRSAAFSHQLLEAVCQKIPDETAQKLVKAYLGGDAADECEKNS